MYKKVLVVDDSALMRRVLSDIINSDERFHVTNMAINGLEALKLILQEKEEFDAIILDINMPKMGGIEFLKQLEQEGIKTIVIVVSTVAKEGAKETIEALECGAFDFVTKPESFLDVKNNKFSNQILVCLAVALKLNTTVNPTVSHTVNQTINPAGSQTVNQSSQLNNNSNKDLTVGKITSHNYNQSSNSKRLIAIACSTGGPKALQRIIPLLPEKLGCSVLIVQHMPVGFTASLANRLNELSKIRVQEAVDGEILKDDVVYIAKGGNQMRIVNQKNDNNHQISLSVEAARNGLKPCADIMYESIANTGYDDIMCVVLTGMGSDGTHGIKHLKDKKNIYVIAQDETSCTVYGMPKVIIDNGLANEIVPLDQIADAITKNAGVR